MVAYVRGQGHPQIGLALLQQTRDIAAANRNHQADDEPEAVNDDELERSHKVISTKRKTMAGKVFVSYKEGSLRIWWLKSASFGVTKLMGLHQDSQRHTSKVTLTFKVVTPLDKVQAIERTFSGTGWKTAPYAYYLPLQEKLTLSLPFKIVWPETEAALAQLRSSTAEFVAFTFPIALQGDGNEEIDQQEDNPEGLL